MYNSPTTKVLVAVSEQVFEPIQVPVSIGNEVFIVTQQDIRKIEDSRHVSFRRLINDNNVKNENDINSSQVYDAINNAFKLRGETYEEQQYIQYLQEQQLNLNMNNNIATAPIQMQMDLEKQSYNNSQTITQSNKCSKLNRPPFHRSENRFRCRGVNTDGISFNFKNVGTCECESLSARDRLKSMKEHQNSMPI